MSAAQAREAVIPYPQSIEVISHTQPLSASLRSGACMAHKMTRARPCQDYGTACRMQAGQAHIKQHQAAADWFYASFLERDFLGGCWTIRLHRQAIEAGVHTPLRYLQSPMQPPLCSMFTAHMQQLLAWAW